MSIKFDPVLAPTKVTISREEYCAVNPILRYEGLVANFVWTNWFVVSKAEFTISDPPEATQHQSSEKQIASILIVVGQGVHNQM